MSDPYDWEPTFLADLPGEYLLSFIVTDGMDPSEPDYMTVTASCPVPPGNMNDDTAVDLADFAAFQVAFN